MKILNDYVEKVKVYFELGNPKPFRARVILEDGDKEEVVLYDGLFIKGKNGYAPLFYVKNGVEFLVGNGERIVKIPTGDSAFWDVPAEFLALARKDIQNVDVTIKDKDDVALMSKVYNYLLKVAPEFRHKYEKDFILDRLNDFEEFAELKYAVINSVNVRTVRLKNEELELVELNDGKVLAQTKRGIYLLFDRRPTAPVIDLATRLALITTDYAVVSVKTRYGDFPIEVWTPMGDVINLIKKMRGGLVLISKKDGEFVAKITGNVYVSGRASNPEDIKKLERSIEFNYSTPVGDVRTVKNKSGDKITVVFTNKTITPMLLEKVEDYVEDISYTRTWVKGIGEELRKAVTVKLPTAVAGFIGKAFKVRNSPLDELDEL